MSWAAVVIASMPEAQLRWTVWAMRSCGTPARQGDDAGDVGGVGRRGDVAEDDLIDLIGPQRRRVAAAPSAAMRPSSWAGTAASGAERLGEGRADAFENGDVEHGHPPISKAIENHEDTRTREKQSALMSSLCPRCLSWLDSLSGRRGRWRTAGLAQLAAQHLAEEVLRQLRHHLDLPRPLLLAQVQPAVVLQRRHVQLRAARAAPPAP